MINPTICNIEAKAKNATCDLHDRKLPFRPLPLFFFTLRRWSTRAA